MSYEADYVRKHLGEPLTLALTEICLKRPKDPMAYLAQWLLHYQRIKGRHQPSKEEQRREFEEVVASARESDAGFAKMDDFWYEGHEPETTKGGTEFGYPFSLVAGDAEDSVSLERRKIEKMVRDMVGQEVARFVPRASSREGSVHSMEDMLKEQIFKRISEETQVPKAVPKEALESLKPGYRELARDYLDELLKEKNLLRVIADKVGGNVLKEGNSVEAMIKEEVLRRILGDRRRSLGSASKDEHSMEDMLKEQIFKRISEETQAPKAVPKEALESLKPGYRELARDYLDELLKEENLLRVIADKVGGNVLEEGNSIEGMIKEEVLRRILSDRRRSLGSASKDEQDDIIWKVVSAGIGKGSSDFDLEAEVDQSKGSSEELSALELMLKDEIARIIRTTKRQESGDLASWRDQDDAERGDIEETKHSLEEILKHDIIQKINAARVEKISSGVHLECAKDEIKRGDEEIKRNSLEEILKDQIIQKIIASGVAKRIPDVDVEAENDGIKQANEEGQRNSLEGMLKDEIIEKIIATGVAKTIPEVKLASGRADDGVEQSNKEGQQNSLEEILKDEIIQRVIADRMRDSAMEVNLQSGIAEDGLEQGHEESENHSLEEILKKEITRKLVAAGLQENGSEGNLESREKLEQGREKTGVSLVDILKNQIIQKLASAKELSVANLADKDVTLLKTNSFEENLKEQILQRLNASRSGVSDAKGEEAEGNSLVEVLKEQIYQSMVALQNGRSVDKMAGCVTHMHGEGSDVEEPSLEEDIKRQIFGRMLADEGDSIEGGIGVKANVGKSLEGNEGNLERMEAVKVGAAKANSNEAVEELDGWDTVRKDKGAGLVRIVVTEEDGTQTDDEMQTETDSSQPTPHLYLAAEEEDEDIIPV